MELQSEYLIGPKKSRLAWKPMMSQSPTELLAAAKLPKQLPPAKASTLYLMCLAERVQELIDAEPSKEAAATMLYNRLVELGMNPSWDGTIETAAEQMMVETDALPDYLRTLGLDLSALPKRVKYSPTADALMRETTLEEWMLALGPHETGGL